MNWLLTMQHNTCATWSHVPNVSFCSNLKKSHTKNSWSTEHQHFYFLFFERIYFLFPLSSSCLRRSQLERWENYSSHYFIWYTFFYQWNFISNFRASRRGGKVTVATGIGTVWRSPGQNPLTGCYHFFCKHPFEITYHSKPETSPEQSSALHCRRYYLNRSSSIFWITFFTGACLFWRRWRLDYGFCRAFCHSNHSYRKRHRWSVAGKEKLLFKENN